MITAANITDEDNAKVTIAEVLRFEVWIYDDSSSWRFNACFDARDKADREVAWYAARGYRTELRFRTTRYQRHAHMTSGGGK